MKNKRAGIEPVPRPRALASAAEPETGDPTSTVLLTPATAPSATVRVRLIEAPLLPTAAVTTPAFPTPGLREVAASPAVATPTPLPVAAPRAPAVRQLPTPGGVTVKALAAATRAVVHTGQAPEDVPFLAAPGSSAAKVAIVGQARHLIAQAPVPLPGRVAPTVAPPKPGGRGAFRVGPLGAPTAVPRGVVPAATPSAVAMDGPKVEVAVLLPVTAVGTPVVVADAVRHIPAALGSVRHRFPTSPSPFPGAAAGAGPIPEPVVTEPEEVLDDEAAVAALVATVRRATEDGVITTEVGKRPVRKV